MSVLLGGLVCCISNGLFIWLYFYRDSERSSAHNILRTAYIAELSKLVLTVVLLTTVLITFEELNFLIFFTVFFASQLLFWVAPLLIKH